MVGYDETRLQLEGYDETATTEWYLWRGMVTQLQLNGIYGGYDETATTEWYLWWGIMIQL